MEPISTTAAISIVVGYLAKKLKDNKSVQDFFDDFTEATINLIRPILLKTDGSPEKVVKDLQEKPESVHRQDAAKSAIAIAMEETPQIEVELHELATLIKAKGAKGERISIDQSKNVVTGPVMAGGHIVVGDSNNVNK